MPRTLISQAAYARRIGVSPQLLAHHIKVGNVEAEGERRLICIEDADAALKDIVKPAKMPLAANAGKSADDALRPATLHEARAEKARQDAERSALAKEREAIELEILKGRIVEVGEVEREWGAALAILRSRLIAIPSRVASRASSASNPHVVQDLIDAEIRAALEELSGGEPNQSRDGKGIPGSSAPASASDR